uniref:Phospholipase B-like n=1 Tax=Alexandrium monilatum TaxID=311494 RepID=A0A7S4SSK6_9DINO
MAQRAVRALFLPWAIAMRHVQAGDVRGGLGCTALAVDGAATLDGSAYAGMNADCSSCDGRLVFIPGAEHPEGAMRPLYIFKGTAPRYVGYGRGSFYEPKEGEALTPKMGELPQVRKTYGYWESTLPLMNEAGLALGESSCAARLLNYPLGQAPAEGDPRTKQPATEGLLDLTNMMQVALERCATARCAVSVMGALSEEYGFFPMVGEWSLSLESDSKKIAFDDGGESITLSDRSGEAWVFHVVGGVPGVVKSVWAAMRLPKGHAAFIANNFILREVPETPNEDWLFSSKMREAAKVAGLWDGNGPLDFARVFAPDTVLLQSPRGEAPIPLYASLRLWRLLGIAAPSSSGTRPLPVDPLELPPSVAVEQPLASTGVFAFLSDVYAGTEFDLTQGALAGPFGNPFAREGGNATRYLGQIPRGISIARTVYSMVGQSRPSAESVMWFATDTPVSSVYVPFYPAAGDAHAPAYSIGTMGEFNRQSAWWAFDFVANWASAVHWRNASGQFLFPLKAQLQGEIAAGMVGAEARAKEQGLHTLAEWQVFVQQKVVDRWWRLADDLIVAYNDGFYNDAGSQRFGLSLGYPEWWARQIGFNQDVHPIFVKRDRLADELFERDVEVRPPDFRAARSKLPNQYDFTSSQWLYAAPPSTGLTNGTSDVFVFSAWQVQVLTTFGALLTGLALGRAYERRKVRTSEGSYALLA